MAEDRVLSTRLDQVIITAPDGEQTLIDIWEGGESGTVEVSTRGAEGEGWLPSEITGHEVKYLRGVR